MRLTNEMRDGMISGLLEHAFGVREAAQAELKRRLAHDVYNNVYSPTVRKAMAVLPKGFLPTSHYLKVKFAGDQTNVNWDESRPIANDHEYSVAVIYDAHSPFTDRYRDLRASSKKLDEEKDLARDNAKAALGQFNTVKQLLAGWPEVEPFLTAWVPAAKPQLPVLRTDVINSMFHLPVKTVRRKSKKVKP